MKHCLTDRQLTFVELAGGLADRFAERAAGHDRDGAFPFDNYEDMRRAGFLRLSLPEELGGLGASQFEMLLALERLAMGDGATALAVNMHVSPLGQWSSVWRRTGDARLEEFLRKAAKDELIWASVTSETGVPNLMLDAKMRARKAAGGYLLRGRKSFATNTSVATHCSTTARYDDPELGPRLMLFRVELSCPDVKIHQTWDALGMRATQSNDVEFADAFVPDDALIHSLPVGHYDGRLLETVFAWSLPAFAAVYVGIAAGAMHWAKGRMARAGRTGDSRVQDVFAECEVLLETSRAAMYRHAEEFGSGRLVEQLTVQEGLARCAFVKYVGTNHAVRIVNKLVEVVGGACYTRGLPFERMWRDVQAGVVMPCANQPARELIGATALDRQLAPALSVEESGPGSRPRPWPAP